MKFWDPSALVPALVDEPASAAVHAVLRVDDSMNVAWHCVIECASAIARLERAGGYSNDEAEAAFRREIAAFPAHAQGYANLAVIRFIRGDRAGSEGLLADMVRANPSSRTCLVAVASNRYSVPCEWAGQMVSTRLYPSRPVSC